jgi:hypothetical protein
MTVCMCERVSKIVDAAPPLTPQQHDRLWVLLAPMRDNPPPAAPSRPKASPCVSTPAGRLACDYPPVRR